MMNNHSRQPTITVDHLIDAIVKKLEANRTVGEIEVELEPKL